jgi:hypothetical protein
VCECAALDRVALVAWDHAAVDRGCLQVWTQPVCVCLTSQVSAGVSEPGAPFGEAAVCVSVRLSVCLSPSPALLAVFESNAWFVCERASWTEKRVHMPEVAAAAVAGAAAGGAWNRSCHGQE